MGVFIMVDKNGLKNTTPEPYTLGLIRPKVRFTATSSCRTTAQDFNSISANTHAPNLMILFIYNEVLMKISKLFWASKSIRIISCIKNQLYA
jgi:hypothetical protein